MTGLRLRLRRGKSDGRGLRSTILEIYRIPRKEKKEAQRHRLGIVIFLWHRTRRLADTENSTTSQRSLSSLVCCHDGVRYEGSRNLPATEPTTVQTLYGLFCVVKGLELDVNLALEDEHRSTKNNQYSKSTDLSLFLDLDELYRTIFILTLALDVFGEVLVPVTLRFPT